MGNSAKIYTLNRLPATCILIVAVLLSGWVPRYTARAEAPRLRLLPNHPTTHSVPAAPAKRAASMWRRLAPDVQRIRVPSTADDSLQPALFYDSGSDRDKPLLVVLHSWSTNYLQTLSIPFAEWAVANDWMMIHPEFRGPFRRPEATASELAQQDILDAVEHAIARGRVDTSRIYITGFSGGAMMALVMAGRFPERWSAVSAWVPVYDLPSWYAFHRGKKDGARYVREIAASCGGPPRAGSEAAVDCRQRSPSAHLAHAKDRVPVLLAMGSDDALVPAEHAVRAFNALADETSSINAQRLRSLSRRGPAPVVIRDPESLDAGNDAAPLDRSWFALFARADAPALLVRQSAQATLVMFRGGHAAIYNPGLVWMAHQRRETRSPTSN